MPSSEPCSPNDVEVHPWTRPSWKGPALHSSCYEFVGRVVTQYDLANKRTIEIGSGIINGTVRDHFTGEYTGVDLALGNGVDRVENSEHLSDANATWECVISTEMLEHVSRPFLAVAEMARICEPFGSVILTARGFDQRGCWEPHGFPSDYFRYNEHSIRVLVEDAGLKVLEITNDPEGPGVFCVARKPE